MERGERSRPAGASGPLLGRRQFLSLVGASVAGLLADRWLPVEAAQSRRPNILLIVADDLGYAGVGCYGCEDIPTPHIDSLARHGIRFTNGYVSCPVCSPTRAGLMTGRYQQRFGHEFNPGPPATAASDFGLPLTEVTLADVLKRAGYATGMVGKWHLGLAPQFHPMKRGFDEYFGFLHGAHSYVDAQADSRNPILRGTTPVDEKEYLTDAFTREAVAFIERHRREPFFLYLTYNAVHTPMHATEKYLQRFQHLADPKRRTHAAMLSAMDDGIGAVLAKLRETKLEENTLIFFLSDNGGPTPTNTSSNHPLRGTKGQVYEGGIRVPFIVQWKGHLPAGKTYDSPVIALDILPTVASVVGAKLPTGRRVDGVDLMPYLTGKKAGAPHQVLFWRFGERRAVRQGNWKLVRIGENAAELYDLATDVGEIKNLATEKPEVVQRLSRLLEEWEKGLMAPRWRPGARRAATATRRARQRRQNR